MGNVEIRALGPGDEDRLEVFLRSRSSTTMILRANAQRVGLVDGDEPYYGAYAAALSSTRVVAAAAHYWNGNLILDCPQSLPEVVRTVLEASDRPLRGIIGPWEQVRRAREVLGTDALSVLTESKEDLFTLDLSRLQVPEALRSGRVRCRAVRPEDIEAFLLEWRIAYDVEALGARPDQAMRERVRSSVEQAMQAGILWVLEEDGKVVATTAFNADAGDSVQVGGVFTPPALRSRGHAGAVVAGSLLEARGRGAETAVLFTGEDNGPAQACYRRLGFERVGDYGVVLFDVA